MSVRELQWRMNSLSFFMKSNSGSQLPEGQTNPIDSGTGFQAITELQEQLKTQQNSLEQWKYKCQEMEKELSSWNSRSGLLEKEINRLLQLNSELEKQIVVRT